MYIVQDAQRLVNRLSLFDAQVEIGLFSGGENLFSKYLKITRADCKIFSFNNQIINLRPINPCFFIIYDVYNQFCT